MTKMLNFTLFLTLLIHFWIAAHFELSHDEAYYWLYSRNLDWGFFDHPPVVGLIIKLFSFLPKSELSVRAGFILMQMACALLLMNLVNKSRQWIALLLFFSFPLASFAGLFALPDLPLLFMTSVYCYFLKLYLEKEDALSVLGLGISIPLLLYSKYHGILLVFFTLIALPKLFKRKSFYLITIISILLFLPHLIWQYQHNFATLRYHFIERPKANFQFSRLLEYTGAQIFLAGLFAGPIVWWTVFKERVQSDFHRSLKFISFGTVLFFFISIFSKKFEANWTIFLTIPLIVLTLASPVWEKLWPRRILIGSLVLVFSLRFLLVADPASIKIKRLTEFHGWKSWAQSVQSKCQNPVLANTYQIASKLSFYLNLPIHALNYGSRKNQFDYWAPEASYYLTPEVCYVTDKGEFQGEFLPSPDGKNLKIVQGFIPSGLTNKNP